MVLSRMLPQFFPMEAELALYGIVTRVEYCTRWPCWLGIYELSSEKQLSPSPLPCYIMHHAQCMGRFCSGTGVEFWLYGSLNRGLVGRALCCPLKQTLVGEAAADGDIDQGIMS